jgi:glycosyltransferase involved in cell wall biosynthesis
LVYRSLIKAFNKPDVILASSVHPLSLVAGLKIARKLHIPCICEVRDLWPEAIFSYKKRLEKSFLGRLMVIGEHWIYKRADALIFTKEGDVDYLKEKKWDSENGGEIDLKKVFYINNGLDLDEFNDCVVSENYSDNDLSSDCFKVVYVGAIRPLNDIEKLVNTAAILKDSKDVIFLIYGEGNQKDYLEKRVKDLKLTNILFKGEVNKEYIPYILSKSSVNILNYTQTHWNWARGNSSNKLFEYMASKKPIISTVKIGYSLIKRYDCGIEIEQATPEELADTILHVKNMPNDEYTRLCENAGRGALDFDFKILAEKLMNVIEQV